MARRPPPAWLVDPGWPAVPPDPDPATPDQPAGNGRSALKKRADAAAGEARRLMLELHRQQRAKTGPQAPAPRPGNPGNPARNDRLLALFERTPAHLPRLQRCRIAAQRYAAAIGSDRVMPPTTVRDAIAEAHRRRAARRKK